MATDEIERVCRDVLAPMIRADGGTIYIVSLTNEDVHLHLAGACSGCPGAQFTREKVVEPLLLAVAPRIRLRVTNGWRVPDGARRLDLR